ncbi:TetR/AcrR family transcriptional regulator [Arenicella xantha]|uniref:TetR family transcriptional regulator n=1 Tax=Arenicella xantha TaxID=644221 RepID=A0A395JQK7_9GAMM|nr:TetR/AcrR family transcriptional regulator [Arenicella xantha]RBP52726.1 TetR family transcriptional regulator [Arenicella xantha]
MKSTSKTIETPVMSNKYAQKKVVAIEAAAQVFADKGFHGATTQDIAAVMGIKQGSLYYYFRSKEQALQEVCEYGFENYVAQMDKICARAQPFQATMQMIITSHLTNYRQKNNAMKVHNDQRLYLPKERRVLLKELGTKYRRLLESTISDGISSNALRADIDPHFVAYSIIGICNSWGAYLVRDEALDLFDTIEQCADLVLRGILN